MKGLRELDRVLRGETNPSAIALGPLVLASVLLAAFYGVCMGIYGLSGRPEPEFRQMIADVVKVPLLFVLTLVVTFPSLYVFNALVGSRLGVADLARLMTAALGVLVAVLAAFGPIVGFFSVTTTSYPFVVLMNVAVFALAAAFGLSHLTKAIERVLPRPAVARPVRRPEPESELVVEGEAVPPVVEPVRAEIEVGPPPASPETVRTVFRVWLAVFALVGAQMSWVLRPFIGSPTREFTWFRPRESSFFEAVVRSVRNLFVE
jgi:hypothetical protein